MSEARPSGHDQVADRHGGRRSAVVEILNVQSGSAPRSGAGEVVTKPRRFCAMARRTLRFIATQDGGRSTSGRRRPLNLL
jgi:hypothetical protein